MNIASAVLLAISTAIQTDTVGEKVFGGISTFFILFHTLSTLAFHLQLCVAVFDQKPAAPSNEMKSAKAQPDNQTLQCSNDNDKQIISGNGEDVKN